MPASPESFATGPDGRYAQTVHAMAMPFTIEVIRPAGGATEDDLDDAVDAILRDLEWADRTFSMWKDDSAVSLIARGEVKLSQVEPAVAEVFEECERFRVATDGAFNATRADGVLDPTGIVKTWAVARAAWRLGQVGASSWMIGASGDVLTAGHGPAGKPWRIGIADPRAADQPGAGPVLDAVELGGDRRALCTSGTAQHGEHIWDAEGELHARYVQVSVVGEDLVAADAWATAIVAGGEATALKAQEAGFEVLCIPAAAPGEPVTALESPGWPSVAAPN